MPIHKVRLEIATPLGREHLRTVELKEVPRVGEKISALPDGTFEIVEVVHTPLIREWDAVVILRAVTLVVAISFLAA